MTSSLLPLEIYEIAKHVSAGRIFALLINLAILAYLVSEMRTSKNLKVVLRDKNSIVV